MSFMAQSVCGGRPTVSTRANASARCNSLKHQLISEKSHTRAALKASAALSLTAIEWSNGSLEVCLTLQDCC